MENLGMNPAFWRGKRVLVTGHTGFKGGWLSLWLQSLGAQVFGFALPPPTNPSFFHAANLETLLAGHVLGDVRDREALSATVRQAAPELVFHLAAQALVRPSYATPVETYATNVMGTVHLLEALRGVPSLRAVVNVTTDKCYENREWERGYQEADPLGGADPYSSSKACSELVTAAYRRSFLGGTQVGVATARAGNVIGGGDWALDRLLPDALRALDGGVPLVVRAPTSVRPWQHVLEPLSGYLTLAERLHGEPERYSGAWNFGPSDEGARTVAWIMARLEQQVPAFRWTSDTGPRPHEAHLLALDSTLARTRLGWRARWDLDTALARTLDWHLAWRQGGDMASLSLAQIQAHAATPTGGSRP